MSVKLKIRNKNWCKIKSLNKRSNYKFNEEFDPGSG